MNTRTDYEKWLNELGCPDHDHPDNDGRVPCICIDIYGTWLRCNDPIAFNVGYQEWELNNER